MIDPVPEIVPDGPGACLDGGVSDPFLTTKQVAAMVGMSPYTMRLWRIDGKGPRWQRMGTRSIRYRLSDVDAWIAAQATGRAA